MENLKALRLEFLDNDTIIRVVMCRPKKLNTFNKDMFNELEKVFRWINTHPTVRAVILQAEGRLFTAGLDLYEMGPQFSLAFSGDGDPARKAVRVYEMVKVLQRPFLSIYECRVPVIVGAHNLCIGAGIDLLSPTDIRYCTKDAKFTIKEIDIGIAADIGVLQYFPPAVGNQSTFRELATTGRFFDAQEAKDIGFVSKVFDDKEQMHAALLETARQIASKSPVGIYTIKQVIRKNNPSIYENLEHMAVINSVMVQTEDTVNAISALTQKKQPVFSKL